MAFANTAVEGVTAGQCCFALVSGKVISWHSHKVNLSASLRGGVEM